ncbi:MAG: hypothetical protein KDC34_09525 [Saprospiraceae bacterium]|nr:hypothetical protein [Saprospiraceae bacterium]
MRLIRFFMLPLLLTIGCQPIEPPTPPPAPTDTEAFTAALENHLATVRNKDYESLVNTLPEREYPMQLILPDGTRMQTVGEFLDMHQEWFQDSSWTMDTQILFADRQGDYGMAVVEAMYREADRGGKPYFHKMYITYALKEFEDKWLVVMDHASTVEKSE